MPILSMTGFAQVKGQGNERQTFTLSLKAVNHRFLDIRARMPAESDALEMKIRRRLQEHLARGHIEVALSLEQRGYEGLQLNRELVSGYVLAFRAAAAEAGIAAEPDLNAILRLPGALEGRAAALDGALEAAVLDKVSEAVGLLNQMRAEEGRGLERELRQRMQRLGKATEEVERLRTTVARALLEKLQARIRELAGSGADQDRVLQEAALLAERSDIEEEVVRIQTHIRHFLALLETGGEAGKKLDFLLQEMNREANTMLSKTSGLASAGLRITELGLEMKAEIEKAREQAQNVE